MLEFFSQLFSSESFPPRWHCGQWTDFHGWLYIASDLGVWSAYTAIPAILIYFVWQRVTIAFKGIFLLFGAFILLCGLTHLLDAVMFWWPAYRFLGLVEFLTALVSWATVVALVPIVPRALAMRSPEELEREIAARRLAETELQRTNQELELRIQQRTAELVLANASLQQEREWFRTTLSSIGDAVIATDTAARVTFFNAVAQSLTGWGEQDAKGQPLDVVFRILNEKTGEMAENPAVRALREGVIVGLANHTVLVSRTGQRRPIDDSAAPIRNPAGQVVGAVLVFRDVTERRAAEAINHVLANVTTALVGALHYQSVMRRVADLTVPLLGDMCFFDVVTLEGEIERIGWKHVDPEKAKLADEVRRFVPSKTAEHHPIASVLTTGQSVMISQLTDDHLKQFATSPEHLRLLRELELCSLMVVPIEVGERRLGTMTFANSVSGRGYTPELLRLAEEIARRTAFTVENARLVNRLKDADQKKDEFLALLAHELRNPLAPMRNAVQFLQLAGPHDAENQAATELIERQIAHMVRLIDDLLDVSRITTGKVELHRQRLRVAEVVEVALETSRPLIEAARHELTVAFPPMPLAIVGDLTRLAQVIANLLNNSSKYTPEGGHIWLTVEQQDADAVIRVRDNGMGIPAEMLPEIFDMFTQVDRNLGRSHGGLGIGLTLVRRLVEMHGGIVEARSEGPERGSEFIVRLPLAPPATPSGDGSSPTNHGVQQGQPKGAAHRILVVDDNVDSAKSLAMVLQATGNQVEVAHDGPQALRLAREFRPQVVLLDIGLPGMDGYDVARKMRQMPETRDAVLVAQTGWGQEEDRQRSRIAGFDHHLVKPLDPAALQSLLAALSP